jgi:hypothetical protein
MKARRSDPVAPSPRSAGRRRHAVPLAPTHQSPLADQRPRATVLEIAPIRGSHARTSCLCTRFSGPGQEVLLLVVPSEGQIDTPAFRTKQQRQQMPRTACRTRSAFIPERRLTTTAVVCEQLPPRRSRVVLCASARPVARRCRHARRGLRCQKRKARPASASRATFGAASLLGDPECAATAGGRVRRRGPTARTACPGRTRTNAPPPCRRPCD